MDLEFIKKELRDYDGPPIKLMEICGSHTQAIASNGIPSMISKKITLVSGPGCPVCVTATAYIDKLIELAKNGSTIVTFGDLIRVPGSRKSLSEIKGEGAEVEMVYSPFDVIELAKKTPEKEFVFAAVGFETTTPVYALLLEDIIKNKIKNIKLLTSLKTMPQIVEQMLDEGADIDGFIAPGHVCVVTGYDIFLPVAKKYGIPFGVSGFRGEELLLAIYGIIRHIGEGAVYNYYTSVVKKDPNPRVKDIIFKYFEKCDEGWRGMGMVEGSGLRIKDEYGYTDAGSDGLFEDKKKNKACCCEQVLMGKMMPAECPLYGKVCQPLNPQGACMVSEEGSCYSSYTNHRAME